MRRFGSAATFAVLLALVGAGAAAWWPRGNGGDPGAGAPQPSERGLAHATPRSRPRPSEARARTGPMGRLTIPAIGLRADVITLGLNADRTLQVPARSGQAGWWKGGAYPGQPGAAVIVGHVDSRRGPAVFFRLARLRRGDVVRFRARGRAAARFVVQASQRAPKDRFPTQRVYRPTRGPSLRLVTCTGTFDPASGHYESNLIVYARGVGDRVAQVG